jgi:hypothetical protein
MVLTPLSVGFYRVSLVLFTCFHGTALVWYFLRRNKFPIPIRRPYLVLMEMLCLNAFSFSWLLWEAFPEQFPVSCSVFLWVSFVTFFTGFGILCFRVAMLWCWDLLTRLSLIYDSQIQGKSLTHLPMESIKIRLPERCQRFIAKHRHHMNIRNLIIIACLLVLNVIGIFSGIQIKWNEMSGSGLATIPFQSPQCVFFEKQLLILATLLVAPPAFVGIILVGISGDDDNFGLFNEMRGSIAAGALICILQLSVLIPGTEYFYFTCKFYHFAAGFINAGLILWMTSYRVIIWTYVTDPRTFQFRTIKLDFKPMKSQNLLRKSQKANNNPLISETLESLDGIRLFEDFLRKEYAVENMLFYNACKNFKEIFTKEQSKAEILKIALENAMLMKDKFILLSSSLAVNISSANRAKILDFLYTFDDSTAFDSSFAVSRDLEDRKSVDPPSRREATQWGRMESLQFSASANLANSAEIKKEIQLDDSRFNRLRHLFDDAEEEIIKLMEHDSFPRFAKTREFSQLKKYGAFAEGVSTEALSPEGLPSRWSTALKRLSCLPRQLNNLDSPDEIEM